MSSPQEINPFSVELKPVGPANTPPRLDDAVEIKPLLLFLPINSGDGVTDLRVKAKPDAKEEAVPVVEHEDKGDGSQADGDPKAPAISSAPDSASSSEIGISESGARVSQNEETQNPIHPSTLPANSEDAASVEKVQSEVLSLSPMNLG